MASLIELRQVFFQECEEQLEDLTDGLTALEGSEDFSNLDPEIINRMFRAVHSVKGGAASFSLDAITQFAHAYESILDELRSGKLTLNQKIINTFFTSADYLTDLVSLGAENVEPIAAELESKIKDLSALSGSMKFGAGVSEEDDCIAAFTPLALSGEVQFPPVEDVNGSVFEIYFKPTLDLYANGHEPVQIFRELSTLGVLEVQCKLDRDFKWDQAEPAIEWHLALSTNQSESEILEIFEFSEPYAKIEISSKVADITVSAPIESVSKHPASTPTMEKPNAAPDPAGEVHSAEPSAIRSAISAAPKATVRVDLDLVDELINLVGELVITQSVMTQSITEQDGIGGRQLSTTLEDFKSLTRTIQEGVMAIRAQSVKPLFQRMARIVRETAQIAGKEVRFATEGEDTEVDRTVIERLVDPLTHILRNAVDHGLEDAALRSQAGKDRIGTVTLSAAHRSGRVVIEVIDDGGGVQREKVLSSAIEKGLVPQTAQLSDSDIDRLLFLPGFSTAASVTNLSGRGVGMDVVNSEIRRLGGRVAIISHPGSGTTISISLPLTLAVLDGMVVDVADETMVVPISAIVETIRPDTSQIHQIGPAARMIAVREKMVPIIELGAVFGCAPIKNHTNDGILVIVEDDKGEHFALAVDKIRDQRQVVIKSLESNYGHVPFVAAATILGDGQIALIVDLDEITHQVSVDQSRSIQSIEAIA
jgi:two-component system chemotaxis sensor kinase CheA